MLARAQIALSLRPASRSAVVTITGPLPAGSEGEVREVVRRAAALAGPRVCVDLRQCEQVDPAVVSCLMASGEDLRARGGFLVCQGLAYPADTEVPPLHVGAHDGVGDGAGRSSTGAVDGLSPTSTVFEPGPGSRAAGGSGGTGSQGSLGGLPDAELAALVRGSIRRRADAVDGLERSAAGRELLDLLVEVDRRRAAPGSPGHRSSRSC